MFRILKIEEEKPSAGNLWWITVEFTAGDRRGKTIVLAYRRQPEEFGKARLLHQPVPVEDDLIRTEDREALWPMIREAVQKRRKKADRDDPVVPDQDETRTTEPAIGG